MITAESLKELSSEAKREIGEEEANIEEMLESLKEVIKESYSSLRLPPNDTEFLLRFLRASKFDPSRAAAQLSKYFQMFDNLKDIHHLMNPFIAKDIFQNLGITVLNQRDSKGRIVILTRQEFFEAKPCWVDAALGAYLILLDFIHRISEDTQRIGVVLIADLQGFSFSHLRHLSPFRVIQGTKLVMGAFPARIKGIHLVRNPTIFNYFYSIAKPFIGKKIKSRFHFHGYHLQSLHCQVDAEILPKYLGGGVDDAKYADLDVISKLVAEEEYYKDWLSSVTVTASSNQP